MKMSGTISITGNSEIVTGTDTDWIDTDIEPGMILTIVELGLTYQVAKFESATSLRLARKITDIASHITMSNLAYTIDNAFTPFLGMAVPLIDDLDKASLVRRNLIYLDRILA